MGILAVLPIVTSCVHTTRSSAAETATEDPAPSGPAYLRAYKEAHYRALGSRWDSSGSTEDWLHATRDAEVVFLGDHHEDTDLHACMADALETLAARGGRRLAIGLEAVGVEDEPALRRFLDGGVDLRSLRHWIHGRWRDSWLESDSLDAPFYRELLEWAREEDAPVFALEPTPRLPLHARDAEIADRIRLARAQMPDRLLVIVIGHAHLLGPGKLVDRLDMRPVVVAARPSRSLSEMPVPKGGSSPTDFVRSDADVWFFRDTVRAARAERDQANGSASAGAGASRHST